MSGAAKGFGPAPDQTRNPDDRLTYRQFQVSTKRPDPPRELGFIGNLLTWRAPQNDKNITHYRVRIDTDYGDPDYELSEGQKSLLLFQGERFYVSSYNRVSGLESKRAAIDKTLDTFNQRIVASFNIPGTVAAATEATNPIELSLPEGYAFRCGSVWANLLETSTTDLVLDILYSTDDTKSVYVSILDAGGAIGAARVSDGGSGYAIGDELTVAGGSGGTLVVEAVGGDPTTDITVVRIETGGTGYTTTTDVTTTTDGDGSGALFNIDVGEVILHAGELQLPVEYKVFTGYPDEFLDLPRRAFLRLDISGSGGDELLVQLVGELVKSRVARGGRSIAPTGGTRVNWGGSFSPY